VLGFMIGLQELLVLAGCGGVVVGVVVIAFMVGRQSSQPPDSEE
jgi:hypothetical protein